MMYHIIRSKFTLDDHFTKNPFCNPGRRLSKHCRKNSRETFGLMHENEDLLSGLHDFKGGFNLPVLPAAAMSTVSFSNPYPGQLFNRPHGPNVYQGVSIDYAGETITPKNILAVLKGNESEVEGGSERVISSSAEDNIFVYFTDHGAPGFLAVLNQIVSATMLRVSRLH